MDLLSTYVRRFGIFLLLLAMTLSLCADNQTEDKVKAAFIFNFIRFIKWPAATLSSATDPFTICTETTEPLDEALEEVVKNKSLDGHPLIVRKLKRNTDVHACQLAFFSGKASIKPSVGVLTVADDNETDVDSEPGVITFVLDSNRVRFAINSKSAERAGLTISSKLLILAIRVDH